MATRADTGVNLDFEAKLWAAVDALRTNMDAAEYKHVVLGLIFLKYISDAFEEQHAKLETERNQGADPEDPDEYRAVNIFWVPKEARRSHLKANAMQPTIGKFVDDAMGAIERDNPTLKGVLPKDYARPGLDKQRLGQLIKRNGRFRNRRGEVLFIDARKLGIMVDRTHRELTDEEIGKIATTYHAWRGDHSKPPFPDGGEGESEGAYKDIPGFCRAATLEDIRKHNYVLMPGRYVGAEQTEDDDEPFVEKMAWLTRTLEAQFTESAHLERTIRENLRMLGV